MEEQYCAHVKCGKKFTHEYDYSKLKPCPVNNVDRYISKIAGLTMMNLFCLKCCEKMSKELCNSQAKKLLK